MKILLPYIILVFFVQNVYSQLVDGDTFLPDMGVVIQPTVKLGKVEQPIICLIYTSPSPRDQRGSRVP